MLARGLAAGKGSPEPAPTDAPSAQQQQQPEDLPQAALGRPQERAADAATDVEAAAAAAAAAGVDAAGGGRAGGSSSSSRAAASGPQPALRRPGPRDAKGWGVKTVLGYTYVVLDLAVAWSDRTDEEVNEEIQSYLDEVRDYHEKLAEAEARAYPLLFEYNGKRHSMLLVMLKTEADELGQRNHELYFLAGGRVVKRSSDHKGGIMVLGYRVTRGNISTLPVCTVAGPYLKQMSEQDRARGNATPLPSKMLAQGKQGSASTKPAAAAAASSRDVAVSSKHGISCSLRLLRDGEDLDECEGELLLQGDTVCQELPQLTGSEYTVLLVAGGIVLKAWLLRLLAATDSAFANAGVIAGSGFTLKGLSIAPPFSNKPHVDKGDYDGQQTGQQQAAAAAAAGAVGEEQQEQVPGQDDPNTDPSPPCGVIIWYQMGKGALEVGRFIERYQHEGQERILSFRPVHGTVRALDTANVIHNSEPCSRPEGSQRVQIGTALACKPETIQGCADIMSDNQIKVAQRKVAEMDLTRERNALAAALDKLQGKGAAARVIDAAKPGKRSAAKTAAPKRPRSSSVAQPGSKQQGKKQKTPATPAAAAAPRTTGGTKKPTASSSRTQRK